MNSTEAKNKVVNCRQLLEYSKKELITAQEELREEIKNLGSKEIFSKTELQDLRDKVGNALYFLEQVELKQKE